MICCNCFILHLYLKKLKFLETSTLITFIFELLPLVFALIFLKKIKANYLKVFFIYTFFLAIFVILSLYSLLILKSMAIYISLVKCYLGVEYTCIAVYFACLFRSKIIKYISIFSIIPFWAFALYDYFKANSVGFNNMPAIISFILCLIFLIYYFFEKMSFVSKHALYKTISFWLCVGLFIYFSGNFFYLLFIMSTKDVQQIASMKTVYTIVSITKDIVLALAWLAHERNETNETIIKIPDGLNLDGDIPLTTRLNPNA